MKAAHRLALLALLLLAAGLRLQHTSVLATQADEGVHVTVAEQVAAGEIVYRDLFENRTPGVEWLLAAVFRLAGPGIFQARVVAVLAALLTMAALYRAGHEMSAGRPSFSAPLTGTVATLLFALAPLPLFWARFTMLEHFATAAATLSIAVVLRALRHFKKEPRSSAILAKRRYRGMRTVLLRERAAEERGSWRSQLLSWQLWLAAGLLAGLAVLAKQTALVVLAATLAFLLLQGIRHALQSRPPGSGRLWQASAAYLLGVGAIFAAFLLVLFLQGALADFLRFLSGVEQVPFLSGASPRLTLLARWAARRPLIPLALLGAIVALARTHSAALLPLLWVAGESGVLLLAPDLDLDWGGFSHYIVPATAALSLLGGYGAAWLARVTRWDLQRALVAITSLLFIAATLPGWLVDLRDAVTKVDYPPVTMGMEESIGQALASVTTPAKPILVVGNAVFYHRAQRAPAARFFHFPQYLADSSLGDEAVESVADALADPGTGAVLVSRMHLDERLPNSVLSSLWAQWVPVARFPYPYQQDLFLFLPRTEVSNRTPEVVFADGLALAHFDIRRPDARTLLVGLHWLSETAPATDYTVFVHLLDAAGNLVAQHDGVPVVGFRPTGSWGAGERIEDWHWLSLPPLAGDGYQLSIGLYNSQSGERLPLTGPLQGPLPAGDEADIVTAFRIPVDIIGNEE